MSITAQEVERRVLGGVDVDVIISRLRAEGDGGRGVLRRLADTGSVELRSWVTGVAPGVLQSAEAADLLLALTRDRDPDVSDDAIAALVEFDPDIAARKLKPVLRKKLRSRDIYEPVAAMWKLAALDPHAGEEIRAAAQMSEYPFHRLVAEAVCLWLAQDVGELERRIGVEDESALHLVIAAEKLDDPGLNDAVAKWRKRAEQRATT